MSAQLFAITPRHHLVGGDGPIGLATIGRVLRMNSLHMKDHLIFYRLHRLELIVKINEAPSRSGHLRKCPQHIGREVEVAKAHDDT
jgi:hypothetical protein